MLGRSLTLTALLAFSLTASAARAESHRLALCPIQGAADADAKRAAEALATQAPSWPGVAAAVRLDGPCPDNVNRLMEAAKAAQSDKVAVIVVEGQSVHVKMIDAWTGEKQEKSTPFASAAELSTAAQISTCELLAPDKCSGTLKVDGPADAHVLVDDADLGVTPFNRALPVGKHAVRVSNAAGQTDANTVVIAARQEQKLQVELAAGKLAFKSNDFDALPDMLLPDDPFLPPPEPAKPAPVVATPAPAKVDPAPVAVTPPPAVVTPPPAVVVAPPPAVVTPPPAEPVKPTPAVVATPEPAKPEPAPAVTTPPPAATPEPALVIALPPGTSFEGTEPAAAPKDAPPAPTAATTPAVTPIPAVTPPPAVVTNTPPVTETTPAPAKTETAVAAKLTPEPDSHPGQMLPKRRNFKPAFYVSAGTAGVALLSGIIFGVVSKTTANSINSKFDAKTLSIADRGSFDTVHTTATVANVSYGVAGLSAIVAGIIFATHPSILGAGGDEPPPVSVGLSGVAVGGRF